MKIASRPSIDTLAAELLPTPRNRLTPSVDSKSTSALANAIRIRVKQITDYGRGVRFTGWADVEQRFNVTIPSHIRAHCYSYLELLKYVKWFEEDSLNNAASPLVVSEAQKLVVPKLKELGEVVCGAFTLRPRQRKARWQILTTLYENKEFAATYITMNTGSGKTAIAAGVIDWLQKNNYAGLGNGRLRMWNVIYVVPKAVKIKTARFLAKAGITGIGTDVQILAYSELRSKRFTALFDKSLVSNEFNDKPTEKITFRMGKPALVIFDEGHKLKKANTSTTRYCESFLGEDTTFMFMSATPAITPQDLRLFAKASRAKFNGQLVDDVNWRAFAFKAAGSPPDEINNSAVRRMFDTFGNAIVNPPSDPRTVKAYNGVKLITFRNDKERTLYENAQKAWLDMCEKMGKEPDPDGQRLVAYTNFRRAVELIAAPQVVQLAIEEFKKGRSPIIADSYKQSVRAQMAEFAKAGFTRDQISIIWGGEPEIKESDVYPLMDWIRLRTTVETEGYVWEDRAARAKYNRSTKYHTTRLKAERSMEDQRELDKWTSAMRLHDQTPEQRQDEIDNFQEGRTRICIFTLAAGGTGLDLDQQIEAAWPRTMFCSSSYHAEEVTQAFGRAYREFTLSDVYQYMVLFEGTVVTNHVVPILMRKLASINSSTRTRGVSGFNLEAEIEKAARLGRLPSATSLTTIPELIETQDVVEDEEDEDEEE